MEDILILDQGLRCLTLAIAEKSDLYLPLTFSIDEAATLKCCLLIGCKRLSNACNWLILIPGSGLVSADETKLCEFD